jgi:predicted enzyme related to lactoylglutathione lyase
MPTMKFDHTYVSVKDMDRAIAFYEDLLGTKVANREGNTWADFDMGNGCFFGLINPDIISEKRIVGNNTIPVFKSDDVDGIYEKVKKYGVKITFPPKDLAFTTYRYYCFECEDTEGNLIEVVDYQR